MDKSWRISRIEFGIPRLVEEPIEIRCSVLRHDSGREPTPQRTKYFNRCFKALLDGQDICQAIQGVWFDAIGEPPGVEMGQDQIKLPDGPRKPLPQAR